MGERNRRIEIDLKWVDRRLLGDVFLTALIVGVLTGIHYGFPADIQALLAFDHEAFRPWSLVTSAYVHRSDAHLWNNISGFLLAAAVVYRLCWLLGKRSWFRLTLPVFLFLLPVLVNLSSYVILGLLTPASSPTGRGFSGVAAAFVGFILTGFLVWVSSLTSRQVSLYVGQAVIVGLVWELSIIYKGFDVLVLGLVGVASVLIGIGAFRETEPEQRRFVLADDMPEIWLAGVFIGVLAVFVLLLFPADFIGDEGATNIFAHAAGMVYGAVSAYIVHQLLYHLKSVRNPSRRTK